MTHEPIPEAQIASQQAIQAIKDRSYSGRHPELGQMINCPFCGLRHRENDNGRDKKCEQTFTLHNGVPAIAGQTPATTPVFLYEGDTQRQQIRLIIGANQVKGKRKNPRRKRTRPLTYWQRILIDKEKKNVQEND